MTEPDDLLTWEDWLAAVHPELCDDRDRRFRAGLDTARAPIDVTCAGHRIAHAGMTPQGVVLVTYLRDSDVAGYYSFEIQSTGDANHTRRVPAAALQVHGIDALTMPYHREGLEAFGSLLWWPLGLAGPSVARTRCKDHLHRLDLRVIIDRCRRIAPGHHARLIAPKVEPRR